ncbi:hypothetical protein DSO57_1038004 [Entomophthora muscae]|uniref:Uncharacterized protein n=1 Tax=Entomophthora muscae TaxID=34485 RepID=A0ACC2TLJ1_9FUNG|nr:hypothetical protein DSO57_1038004 [Entomophthora muscae]
MHLLDDLPEKAHGLFSTGKTLVHSLTFNDVEFALPTEVPISCQNKVFHVLPPVETVVLLPPNSMLPTSEVPPQAHLLACFGHALDEPEHIPPQTVPCLALLVPCLSFYPSPALGGILVSFPARMRAELSYFSSLLAHKQQQHHCMNLICSKQADTYRVPNTF